ncbi:MAG: tyrosine-type recombinase/integrase [Bacilli bacterium]|nr:tyrosine-type recombinase/integrase [Bacilli bacterium]
MGTIQVKGSYKRVNRFLKGGGTLLDNSNDNKIITLYKEYLVSTDNKENTILLKLRFVYLLNQYLISINKTFKTFTKENIYDYFEECLKLSWELSYQDRNKLDIKVFLNWSYINNLTKISGDMVLPKIVWHRKTNIRTYYTKEEVTKLLNVIDIRTKQGKEDYLIFSLICFLGLRISDVINLKLSNINFNNNTISIIQYKTDNKLILPLIDKVKYPLLDYLKNVRSIDTDLDYVFITTTKPYRHHTELKTHNYIVKDYLIKAGIDINGRKHGFHSLRHSFSSLLLKENTSLYSISTILGHQDIKTTMSYLDIDTSKLKELALEVPYVK